jgi:hypothetical protein
MSQDAIHQAVGDEVWNQVTDENGNLSKDALTFVCGENDEVRDALINAFAGELKRWDVETANVTGYVSNEVMAGADDADGVAYHYCTSYEDGTPVLRFTNPDTGENVLMKYCGQVVHLIENEPVVTVTAPPPAPPTPGIVVPPVEPPVKPPVEPPDTPPEVVPEPEQPPEEDVPIVIDPDPETPEEDVPIVIPPSIPENPEPGLDPKLPEQDSVHHGNAEEGGGLNDDPGPGDLTEPAPENPEEYKPPAPPAPIVPQPDAPASPPVADVPPPYSPPVGDPDGINTKPVPEPGQPGNGPTQEEIGSQEGATKVEEGHGSVPEGKIL